MNQDFQISMSILNTMTFPLTNEEPKGNFFAPAYSVIYMSGENKWVIRGR